MHKQGKITVIYLMIMLFIAAMVFLPNATKAQTPVEDKVAVLITGWGMPSGYNFNYSYYGSIYPRCGDLTDYEGQPCKIGHVGEFPYMAHINLIPWAICFQTPGQLEELFWDSHGIYRLESGVYVSPNPAHPLSITR